MLSGYRYFQTMLTMGSTVFGVGDGGLAASASLAAACLSLHFCLVAIPKDTWRLADGVTSELLAPRRPANLMICARF